PEEQVYFLEVDRSTETLKVILRKLSAYVTYSRSGGFVSRVHARRRPRPFRVLLVCRSRRRCDSILTRVRNEMPHVRTQILVCTLADVVQRPSEPIWRCPDGRSRSWTLFTRKQA